MTLLRWDVWEIIVLVDEEKVSREYVRVLARDAEDALGRCRDLIKQGKTDEGTVETIRLYRPGSEGKEEPLKVWSREGT